MTIYNLVSVPGTYTDRVVHELVVEMLDGMYHIEARNSEFKYYSQSRKVWIGIGSPDVPLDNDKSNLLTSLDAKGQVNMRVSLQALIVCTYWAKVAGKLMYMSSTLRHESAWSAVLHGAANACMTAAKRYHEMWYMMGAYRLTDSKDEHLMSIMDDLKPYQSRKVSWQTEQRAILQQAKDMYGQEGS